MELDEARHTAGFLQGLVDFNKSYSLTLSSTENAVIYEATIVLCDRLTELEAQLNTKSNKETKHRYGEYSHVLLTDEQYQRVQEKTGDVKKWITILDEGIELKKYKYNSHYLAILKWFKKDSPELTEKKRSTLIPLTPLTEMEKAESAQQAAELANKYLGTA